ncbi:hypothetical protein HanIR_Chr10g0490441 [Helianthus annuus]|nr:hypothetical protein HanIR_Chr10g0490441 [Helianthus annuus]
MKETTPPLTTNAWQTMGEKMIEEMRRLEEMVVVGDVSIGLFFFSIPKDNNLRIIAMNPALKT